VSPSFTESFLWIVYANGQYLSPTANHIFTSHDGKSWSQHDIGQGKELLQKTEEAIYTPIGLYAAMSVNQYGGTAVLVSRDGLNWNVSLSIFNMPIPALIPGSLCSNATGIFVAAGGNQNWDILYSEVKKKKMSNGEN